MRLRPEYGAAVMAPIAEEAFHFRVADLEREGQLDLHWELPPHWLSAALADTDATAGQGAGSARLQLFMNGAEIVVRGEAKVNVVLPCARTLDPAEYTLNPTLFLVLRRAPGAQQSGGRTRGAKAKEDDADKLLDDEDAALELYTGESVDLGPFLREQIILDLPMFPLRSDLRSKGGAAMPPPPRVSPEDRSVDPRLQPLQAIAEKLKARK